MYARKQRPVKKRAKFERPRGKKSFYWYHDFIHPLNCLSTIKWSTFIAHLPWQMSVLIVFFCWVSFWAPEYHCFANFAKLGTVPSSPCFFLTPSSWLCNLIWNHHFCGFSLLMLVLQKGKEKEVLHTKYHHDNNMLHAHNCEGVQQIHCAKFEH